MLSASSTIWFELLIIIDSDYNSDIIDNDYGYYDHYN